jgi:putative endonuclease
VRSIVGGNPTPPASTFVRQKSATASFSYFYVNYLQSLIQAEQTYISCTQALRVRIDQHNAGKSIHTNKFKPWNLMAYIALPEQRLAKDLERCLKSGSGRAFAKRHFVTKTG